MSQPRSERLFDLKWKDRARGGGSSVSAFDPEWVAEHLAEVHVLDVRQPEELHDKLGHRATAQCVPLNELKDRLAEVPKDKPVIPVCHAGMRSGQATVILRDAGFSRVANLHGGMLLWQQMGLPVLRSTSPLPK